MENNVTKLDKNNVTLTQVLLSISLPFIFVWISPGKYFSSNNHEKIDVTNEKVIIQN